MVNDYCHPAGAIPTITFVVFYFVYYEAFHEIFAQPSICAFLPVLPPTS